ncbi:MAG: galactose mutarotase [Bacteroidales bacterium]|nr:galactose mutarotase [Bacteroidales bacterium]
MKQFFLVFISLIFLEMMDSCNNTVKFQLTGSDHEKEDSLNISIMKTHFGTVNNKEISLFTLHNSNGIIVKITNYGAIITSIIVPDRNGKAGDIVLGFDSLQQYLDGCPYFGAIVGRYANRIARGQFTLDRKHYQLAVNDGKNSLHGGIKGFDKMIWQAKEIGDSTMVGLVLTYLSRDGEEGYPGNLNVKVTYTLNNNNEFSALFEATSDKPTPVNLCNHSYFNLNGANRDVLNHILTLYADQYTPVDGELIPTGKILPVTHTCMDFNASEPIGSRIEQVSGGYDHNYILTKKGRNLEMAAQVYDPETGRQLELLTTQPGVQFYTGNFLDGTLRGKEGKLYEKHFGFCLETQHYPDSPNHHEFPNTILNPGEKFSEQTVYRFSVIK